MVDLLDDVLDLGPRAKSTDPAAVTAEERSRRQELPAANRDLEDWAPPADAPRDPLCHALDDRPAKYHCNQCGRGACAEHYWVMFGLCTTCAKEERVRRWHDEATPEEGNWLDQP